MSLKQTLGFRILASLGNGCLNRKGYKMRCLQIHFTNGIKRIRDKTFCFDVWLGPNPCTWHIARIHGVGCKFAESRGIRMFEFAPLLLWKWAMTSSLSQNSFYQLQAKCEWLTILESLKKKTNKANGHNHQPNKQGAFTSLKRYILVVSIWGSYFKLLWLACASG